MRLVSVKVRAALLYLFTGMLVYLAGVYVNPLCYYLYIFLSLFPLISVLQVVLTLASLRCFQEFDTDQPVKGGTVGYRLCIRGSRFLATGSVHIRFAAIHPRLPDRIPDITLTMSGRGTVEERYTIRCLYRGTYTVGIESLEIRDVLGWLAVRKPADFRTFHVYPRVTELDPPPLGRDGHLAPDADGRSGEHDPTMFEGLETYREGFSVKHIAWKKFLATGVPFLKQFGRRSESGIAICIDLRGQEIETGRELETEDCSIETAVSLVKSLLESGVPVTVRASGEKSYRFNAGSLASFAEFYRWTHDLAFVLNAPSPLELLSTRSGDEEAVGPTLIITHVADPAILDQIGNGRGDEIAVLVNLCGLDRTARQRVSAYRDATLDGGGLFLVESADSLKEDSMRWRSR